LGHRWLEETSRTATIRVGAIRIGGLAFPTGSVGKDADPARRSLVPTASATFLDPIACSFGSVNLGHLSLSWSDGQPFVQFIDCKQAREPVLEPVRFLPRELDLSSGHWPTLEQPHSGLGFGRSLLTVLHRGADPGQALEITDRRGTTPRLASSRSRSWTTGSLSGHLSAKRGVLSLSTGPAALPTPHFHKGIGDREAGNVRSSTLEHEVSEP
jgi:hypothetical protein